MEHTTSEKLISVIIPAHNTAHYIGRAIRSVLAQTYRNFEIIVVDDCSSDNLAEVIAQFNDKHIHYIRHEINRGGSAARNTGLNIAKGEYIAFLDSDDEWFADKLQKQLDLFQKSPNDVGMVYTGWRWIREKDGKIIQDKNPAHRGNLHQLLLSVDCIGSMSTPLIVTAHLRSIGGFDESLPARQDWDLWLRLSKVCMYDFVPEVLVNYFIRGGSISSSGSGKIKGTEMVLEKYRAEFNQNKNSLANHYIVLTILYLLENNLPAARRSIHKSLSINPVSVKILWKNSIHYILSFLSISIRRKYFKLMRLINKDFYWLFPD